MHLALIIFFVIGYIAIIFEKFLQVNKSATALLMGAIAWLIFYISPNHFTNTDLAHQVADTFEIIFFLLAVMTIVELIDSHHGFKIITQVLYTSSKRKMLWFLIAVSFFMSAILDNLTTMIVMISLLKKMIENKHDRWILGSIIVISVNAGGAWTPIGDVTTTMLWINDNISTWETIKALFLPSAVNILVCGGIASCFVKGSHPLSSHFSIPMQPGARSVLLMGIISLLLIPFWKAFFGLPPFLGALLSLGLLWLITDFMHFKYGDKRSHLRIMHILTRIDMAGIIFFLGILLAINALNAAGILKALSDAMHKAIPNQNWVAVIIGLASSIIDNVPIVAATMGMYPAQIYPQDSPLWQLIAYAAGTGEVF